MVDERWKGRGGFFVVRERDRIYAATARWEVEHGLVPY